MDKRQKSAAYLDGLVSANTSVSKYADPIAAEPSDALAPALEHADARARLLASLKSQKHKEMVQAGMNGTDPGTVVLQAEVVCDYKTVWRELCDIYDEVQTQEELLKVSKIVLPHLFCSETRTIGELARLTDENGEYMPLTLMIEDVESGTAQGSSVAVVHAVLGTHVRASI